MDITTTWMKITWRWLIRKGLKPREKKKKKGNLEIIEEQRELMVRLEAKVKKLRKIVESRNEEIANLAAYLKDAKYIVE